MHNPDGNNAQTISSSGGVCRRVAGLRPAAAQVNRAARIRVSVSVPAYLGTGSTGDIEFYSWRKSSITLSFVAKDSYKVDSPGSVS